MSTCRGDWMKLRLGDSVYDGEDEKHIGIVTAIEHGSIVHVRWPNGWRSELQLDKVRKVK